MKIVAILLALLVANVAYADRVHFGQFPKQETVKVEGFVQYVHQSDLFEGPLLPWTSYGDMPYEPTLDLVTGGGTISWKRWEVDLSHGWQAIDCDLSAECDVETGSHLSGRFYFRRSDSAFPLYDVKSVIRIEPFVTYIHVSDIFRGAPFNNETAPQNDFMGIGLTIQYRKVEFDISHGVKSRTCSGLHTCEWRSSTVLAFRLYPGREP